MFAFDIALAQHDGFGMPVSGCASTGAFPTSAVATRVRGYGQSVVLATAKGDFPGTSAWSPPI